MEKIAWLFNADFEQKLFHGDIKNLQSTKINQEFEYLLHLVDPEKITFSTKNYSKSYRDYIEKISNKPFLTTQSTVRIEPWLGSFHNRDQLLIMQDKVKTLSFLVKNNLTSEKISFIKSREELEAGYLYKSPTSFSGKGHFLYPRDKNKMVKVLTAGEVLIKERIHSRVCDFSTLVFNNGIIAQYENIIDEKFQYKGSVITNDFKLKYGLQASYKAAIKGFLEYTQDYMGYLSLDSYLYLDNSKVKLFPVCEINARKTMGYIANSLYLNYFSRYKVMKFLIIKNTGFFREKNIEELQAEGLFLLSPVSNTFLSFVLVGETKADIELIEKKFGLSL